jgi:hypothetical protein
MIAGTMIVAARAEMMTAAAGTTGAKTTVAETVIAMLHVPAGVMTMAVLEAIMAGLGVVTTTIAGVEAEAEAEAEAEVEAGTTTIGARALGFVPRNRETFFPPRVCG